MTNCTQYSPDIQAQGDCRNCGHTYASHPPAPQGAPETWPDVAYLSMHDTEHPDEGGEWLNSPLDYIGGIKVKSYTDKATSDARIAELEAQLKTEMLNNLRTVMGLNKAVEDTHDQA